MSKNDIHRKIDEGIDKWEDSWITREKPWVVMGVLFFTHVIPLTIIIGTWVMGRETASYPLLGVLTVLMVCFVYWTFQKLRYTLAYKSENIDAETRLAIIERKLKWIRVLSRGYLITGLLLLAGCIATLMIL